MLSLVLVALNGFRGPWYIYVFRFLILFSSIIPIRYFSPGAPRGMSTHDFQSLRVNLDMGKTVYAHQIMHDSEIPNTIVRTSTLPEELGRITYLLSDKTGTLTQNGAFVICQTRRVTNEPDSEMEMKKLHMGTMSFGFDSMDEVAHQLSVAYGASGEHGM